MCRPPDHYLLILMCRSPDIHISSWSCLSHIQNCTETSCRWCHFHRVPTVAPEKQPARIQGKMCVKSNHWCSEMIKMLTICVISRSNSVCLKKNKLTSGFRSAGCFYLFSSDSDQSVSSWCNSESQIFYQGLVVLVVQ